MSHQVFLSYASEDTERARQLRDGLAIRGLSIWFDKQDLGVGKWKRQLRRAIVKSRYFVICLSAAAIKKLGDTPGYQDQELEQAYSIAQEQDESLFSIVPVRFEECGRGDHRIAVFQHFDLFDDWDGTLDRLAVQMGGNPRVETDKALLCRDADLLQSLLWKSSALYFTGKYSEALAVLDAILAAYGPSKIAWNNKGAVLSQLRRFEEGLAAYERALEIDGSYSCSLSGIAGVLVNLGRNAEALPICRKLLALNPKDSSTLATASGALIGVGLPEKALQLASSALQVDPRHVIALANKGAALGKLNDIPGALAASEEALRLDPQCVVALNSQGDMSEASRAVRRSCVGVSRSAND